MELNKCLKERRSIRSFSKRSVSFENIVKILDAGRYAPSSGNIQNQVFIVVKDSLQKEKIAKACDQGFVKNADKLIAVCSNENRIGKIYGKMGERYSIQNCAASMQNMLLEAYSLGIGSCWIGDFDDNKLKKILDIKEGIKLQALIALGYSNEEKREARRNNLENFVFFEKYGNKKRK